MTRKLLHAAIFLLGLLGTAAGIRSFDELPFTSTLRTKLQTVLAANPAYDTLLIGSSRFERGVIPALFDGEMRAHGTPTLSFNLGVAGRQPHDFVEIVGWVLAHRPPRLRHLIVEAQNWNHGTVENRWLNLREIECFTPRQFWPMTVTAWQCAESATDVLTWLRWSLVHTTMNLLRIGQGPRIVDDIIQGQPAPASIPDHQAEARGFAPISVDTAPDYRVAQHTKWRGQADEAIRNLRYKTPNNPRHDSPGFRVDLMADLVETCRRADIDVTFVLMPCYFAVRGKNALRNLPDGVRCIDLDVVREHQELFEIENWFDAEHLTFSGAEILSRELAARYATVLAGRSK